MSKGTEYKIFIQKSNIKTNNFMNERNVLKRLFMLIIPKQMGEEYIIMKDLLISRIPSRTTLSMDGIF